jgi:hypothetical protein
MSATEGLSALHTTIDRGSLERTRRDSLQVKALQALEDRRRTRPAHGDRHLLVAEVCQVVQYIGGDTDLLLPTHVLDSTLRVD